MLRRNAQGQLAPVLETTTVALPIVATETASDAIAEPDTGAPRGIAIESIEEVTAQAEARLATLAVQLSPRPGAPRLRIPRLRMSSVKSQFSLADIIDLDPFRKLGEQVASNPDDALKRVAMGARVITGPDGLRRVERVSHRAVDSVPSPASRLPLADAREQLIAAVLSSSMAPARANQRLPAEDIVDAFIRGLGSQPERPLSAYFERAAARLVGEIAVQARKANTRPTFEHVVELTDFGKPRTGRAETSDDRYGPFHKGVGYNGYAKSLYAQDWFDSSPERDVANLLEDDPAIASWARLQIGDLPILWKDGSAYNPDFIAVEKSGVHWLVEVKMDKEMQSADVRGKREAAMRWANHVNADASVGVRWRYLLVSETDVKSAKGSWDALKHLGGAE